MIRIRLDWIILALQIPALVIGTALIWHYSNFGVAIGAFVLTTAAGLRRMA